MDKIYSITKRLESEISTYETARIEIAPEVFYSQYQVIKRIFKFKNRDLSGTKLNEDLSYNYYYDIISPRVDSEVKNLRFDTKNVVIFSQNPRADFAAVFLSNASLKKWMSEKGEDEKLKSSVEEFSADGNVLFKKIKGGYERTDPLNTYITNQRAETVDDTDIIERHEMTASELKRMSGVWDDGAIDASIEELGNKTFQATNRTSPNTTTSKRYEIWEFSGEVSEKEYNECKGIEGGDDHTYFLAKIIFAGLNKSGTGMKYVLYAEKLSGTLCDWYLEAHRGRYEGRWWRVGMYELLFDHQIRANQIGNDLAIGLEWASKTIFTSSDSRVLQNIRADLENGDVIVAQNLTQLNVRMQGLDQLIADWNRLMQDADRLANSSEVTRGESQPAGTPFRQTALLDDNAGKMFIFLRQKITLPYQRVFKNWILPELIKDLKGYEIFRLVGDTDIEDQFRQILVDSWYMKNLVQIGPHTSGQAVAIKQEKMDELKRVDPTIENSKEIWDNVKQRFFITITGENSDLSDQVTDMVSLMNLETDPDRLAWLLDTVYKVRGIPVPPKKPTPPSVTTQNPADSQQQIQQAGSQPTPQQVRQQRTQQVGANNPPPGSPPGGATPAQY